jgi:L-threonylcarbamoyladenylate synthase
MTQAGAREMTRLLRADASAIAEAAACLRAGGLVAMPTETVYGLAADATSDRAVAAIYAAKGRPAFNPLIAHVTDVAAARHEARLDAYAERLAAAFWPGPLTLVAPVAEDCRISALARAGLDSVALRAPRHEVARALIEASGAPLAAPSANRSGHVSATTADHVAADLSGRIDLILDGGPTQAGLESTIIACLGGAPRLLRHGAIARETIESALGVALDEATAPSVDGPRGPGMLSSHYAPRASVRLDARDVRADEAALDFAGALEHAGANRRLDLSAKGDLLEAAVNLFSHLRALDEAGVAKIAAAPIPTYGLGAAINDRLRRAAAPRPAR